MCVVLMPVPPQLCFLRCTWAGPDKKLEYHFKFRFWYQPYNETTKSHKSISGGWGSNLGAGGGGLGAEFDVPKCAEGVKGCSKGADGSWVHTVVGIQRPSTHPGSQLVAAHMHCHAPTCLSMSIANNATGEMICEQRPSCECCHLRVCLAYMPGPTTTTVASAAAFRDDSYNIIYIYYI
jgi:hypothetical protein